MATTRMATVQAVPRWAVVATLAAALAARLATGVWFQSRLDGRFAFGDSESYWVLAQQVAAGGPYEWGPGGERIFRMPGYPVLLAPIFLVAGHDASVLWGRAASALFGTAAVAATWLVARRLFDDRAAFVAALVAAFYPEAVAAGALVLSEAPFSCFMMLNLWAWMVAWRHGRCLRGLLWGFAAGCLAAITALVHPSWLAAVPFFAAAGALAGPERRRHCLLGAVAMVGFALVMAPWWIRNALVVGRFVPSTLQVGASLYDGLNPAADGSSQMDFMARFTREGRRRHERLIAERPEEFEYLLDREIRQAALQWARQNPGRVAQLAAIKFARMWSPWPNERSLSSRPIRWAIAASYLPVLLLSAIAAWRFRAHWLAWLCWLPAVYLTLLHLVFVSSIRYREPAMLGLIVLAAAVLARSRIAGQTPLGPGNTPGG